MLTEILGCLNIRVAGGTREKVLYGLLLIFSGGLFTYAAIGILPTYRERTLSVTYYDSDKDADWISQHGVFPDFEMMLDPNYDQAKVKPYHESFVNYDCSGWELDVRGHLVNDLCVTPYDLVCKDLYCHRCEEGDICQGWHTGPFEELRLAFTTSHNFPVSSDMKWQSKNELSFCDPRMEVGRRSCTGVKFPAIAHDIYVSIKMIGLDRYYDSKYGETIPVWEYEATVNAVPVYNPAYEMPNETRTTITVHVSNKIEVREFLEKSAWEVWAELGGAWGGAMLVLGVCFAQKSVRGKSNTSPNTEVQVFRLRKIGDRRALLQELAAMLQDAEEASEANGGPCRADVIGKAAEVV